MKTTNISPRMQRFKDAGLLGCFDGSGVTSENCKDVMNEWKLFTKIKYAANPLSNFAAPFDSKPFLACIWGEWVGQAIYARHYDATDNRCPGKYEFFYVTQNPEDEGWKIHISEDPFPITHWMPLPKSPEKIT